MNSSVGIQHEEVMQTLEITSTPPEILNFLSSASQLSIAELESVCRVIRDRILDVVSKNGGHLSSTLGAVELIVGMHSVFNSNTNPFIFDVGHQAYAHKLLNGCWEKFETLRKTNGLSGFTKPIEGDYFVAGHSSTSISLAVGAAKAIALNKEDRIPIVLIGDGAMSAGLTYEALNELGDRKYPVIIILNDNEMSIAKPIGAISKYLSQAIAGKFFQGIKEGIGGAIRHLPKTANESAIYLAKRFEDSLKLITPGGLFQQLGLEYIGPIDGHDLKEITTVLKIAKDMKKPVLIHAQTLKGKGYQIAEGHLEKWHGVGPFDLSSGLSSESASSTNLKIPAPTDVFSKTLLEIARMDDKVVGITAAMPGGTGLHSLIDEFPDRFWDVAIAEQHAVTSASSLAKEGFKPFVAIYSTFLQRAFDQIVHDVGILNTPVRFAIDRAGIVGEDGETHQGIFDVSFLRMIPKLTIFAPRDNETLKEAIKFAGSFDSGACAFRYPRKKFAIYNEIPASPFKLAQAEMLKEGKDILLVGFGNGVGRAYWCAKKLKQLYNLDCGLLDLRFLKPLDTKMLLQNTHYPLWFVFSDNVRVGGVGSALSEFFSDTYEKTPKIISMEFNDTYIPHGKTEEIEKQLGIDTLTLTQKIYHSYQQVFKDNKSLK